MRRSSRLLRLPVELAALLVFATACGGGAEISLQLEPGFDDTTRTLVDTSSINALHVVITSNGKRDEGTVAFDPAHQVDFQPKDIDKTKPVSVEVWGCQSTTCESADVDFLGCTREAQDLSQLAGTKTVTIEMFTLSDPHVSDCEAP